MVPLSCPTCQVAWLNVGGCRLLCMGLFSMFWSGRPCGILAAGEDKRHLALRRGCTVISVGPHRREASAGAVQAIGTRFAATAAGEITSMSSGTCQRPVKRTCSGALLLRPPASTKPSWPEDSSPHCISAHRSGSRRYRA